ncbi:MAG: DNA-directed RNA polymerase subunit beta, partial [Parcubacteria group bacterium Greene0416_79]
METSLYATGSASRPQKHFGRYTPPQTTLPNLVEPQLESFKWFLTRGLSEVFSEFATVKDYSGKKFELELAGFSLSAPKYGEFHAKQNKLSYEAPLKVTVRLRNKLLGSVKEQEIFMADLPLMTAHGTFIISGIERVIVPQLARSFGVFFTADEIKGKKYFGAKIIPARGAWIEIEMDVDGALYARIDRKRKFPVTALLRVLARADFARQNLSRRARTAGAKPNL